MLPEKATDKESGRPSKVTPVFAFSGNWLLSFPLENLPSAASRPRYAQSLSFNLFIFLKIPVPTVHCLEEIKNVIRTLAKFSYIFSNRKLRCPNVPCLDVKYK